MTKDVIAMAREAGFSVDLGRIFANSEMSPSHALCTKAIHRFATLVRNAALEEAAQKCEYTGPQGNPLALINQAFAQEIRNLKEPT